MEKLKLDLIRDYKRYYKKIKRETKNEIIFDFVTQIIFAKILQVSLKVTEQLNTNIKLDKIIKIKSLTHEKVFIPYMINGTYSGPTLSKDVFYVYEVIFITKISKLNIICYTDKINFTYSSTRGNEKSQNFINCSIVTDNYKFYKRILDKYEDRMILDLGGRLSLSDFSPDINSYRITATFKDLKKNLFEITRKENSVAINKFLKDFEDCVFSGLML